MSEPSPSAVLGEALLRRNRIAFLLEITLYGIGMAYLGIATTVPAFIARLTENPLLIGTVGALWTGGWLLPQVAAAHLLTTIQRKLPVAKLLAWLGRPVFIGLAVYLVLGGIRWPRLTLGLVFFAILFFSVTDAVLAVAWFDVFAKALPVRLRGKLIGWGQLASGVLSVVPVVSVSYLLGTSGPAFPLNFAAIFALAGVGLILALACLYLISEPLESVPTTRPPLKELPLHLVRILRSDRAYLRVSAARLMIGFSAMAMPFYAIFAIHEIGLPESSIGFFIGAQTIGGVLAGVVLGPLADRSGCHRAIQVMGIAHMLCPLVAIAAGAFLPKSQWGQVGLFGVAFLLLGAGESSRVVGVMNYVLEIAPAPMRPLYVGLTNTVAGLAVFFPILGGWISGELGYQPMFAISALMIACGGVLAFGLPNPRLTAGSAPPLA